MYKKCLRRVKIADMTSKTQNFDYPDRQLIQCEIIAWRENIKMSVVQK